MERAIFGQITFSNFWSLGKIPSKKVLIIAIFKNCWFKNKANEHDDEGYDDDDDEYDDDGYDHQ